MYACTCTQLSEVLYDLKSSCSKYSITMTQPYWGYEKCTCFSSPQNLGQRAFPRQPHCGNPYLVAKCAY